MSYKFRKGDLVKFNMIMKDYLASGNPPYVPDTNDTGRIIDILTADYQIDFPYRVKWKLNGREEEYNSKELIPYGSGISNLPYIDGFIRLEGDTK